MFQIVDMTDMGNGRDSNQDSYLLKEEEICGQQILMAVMCDGMGGLSRGEIASGYIVGSLDRWFAHTLPVLLQTKDEDHEDSKGTGGCHQEDQPPADPFEPRIRGHDGEHPDASFCGRPPVFCTEHR